MRRRTQLPSQSHYSQCKRRRLNRPHPTSRSAPRPYRPSKFDSDSGDHGPSHSCAQIIGNDVPRCYRGSCIATCLCLPSVPSSRQNKAPVAHPSSLGPVHTAGGAPGAPGTTLTLRTDVPHLIRCKREGKARLFQVSQGLESWRNFVGGIQRRHHPCGEVNLRRAIYLCRPDPLPPLTSIAPSCIWRGTRTARRDAIPPISPWQRQPILRTYVHIISQSKCHSEQFGHYSRIRQASLLQRRGLTIIVRLFTRHRLGTCVHTPQMRYPGASIDGIVKYDIWDCIVSNQIVRE
jgi:hypothetical protein